MGLAYLPDGTRIDYKEYISSHPRWQAVRKQRFDFDDGRCAICHRDLHGEPFETHHLSYQRLGREHMRDVVTICPACHKTFHQNWQRQQFWRGKESGHWDIYNLPATAQMCAAYWQQDRLICGNIEAPNLCNIDTAKQYIDIYFRDFNPDLPCIIDPNDFTLFVRNKRYELFFEAEGRGLTVLEFLDEKYGPKVRGKNPIRVEAGKKRGPFDHTPESFHRHYKENKNILTLMQEVEKYEQHP